MLTCWYCGNRTAEPDATVEVTLVRERAGAPVRRSALDGANSALVRRSALDGAKTPETQEPRLPPGVEMQRVWVPRCARCEADTRGRARLEVAVFGTGILACLLVLGWWYVADVRNIVGLGISAGTFAAVMLVWDATIRRGAAVRSWKDHPDVVALLSQGFRIWRGPA